MQGLLTLDFGNTHPHAGLFTKHDQKWNLEKVISLNELQTGLDEFGMNADNSSVVLCEVRPREDVVEELQRQGFLITRLKDYWRGNKFAGMPVHYSKTLGEDRLIEAFYCYKNNKLPSLIVDSGTFLTIDVVNENGFMGGYIAPGIENYFKIFENGAQLKEVAVITEFENKLPNNTSSAITNSYLGFMALANNLIQEHRIINIMLTGGASQPWETFFKNEKQGPIVERHPHLIHSALHYWMTTQIEPL